MSIRDFNWSPGEKKIARAAFNKAYNTEMNKVKSDLVKKVNSIDDFEKIWSINNYLNKKLKEINTKYDYRYSVLILVFVRLLSEGFIEEKDLEGLSEEKLEAIRILSK